jgi:hypothetical protein
MKTYGIGREGCRLPCARLDQHVPLIRSLYNEIDGGKQFPWVSTNIPSGAFDQMKVLPFLMVGAVLWRIALMARENKNKNKKRDEKGWERMGRRKEGDGCMR